MLWANPQGGIKGSLLEQVAAPQGHNEKAVWSIGQHDPGQATTAQEKPRDARGHRWVSETQPDPAPIHPSLLLDTKKGEKETLLTGEKMFTGTLTREWEQEPWRSKEQGSEASSRMLEKRQCAA